MQTQDEHAGIIVRGPSQTGKTTFVNENMEPGQASMPTGDGSGESVTTDTAVRRTMVGLIVDGPGDNDSGLRFTNEEAGRRYAVAVAAAGLTRVKALVFESMASPTIQLRASLASLKAAFGETMLQGIVVILSQCDLRMGQARERRIEAVRTVMAEQGLSELVLWQHSESLNTDEIQAQRDELSGALSRVSGVNTADLEDLWQRQRRRAQELCDAQPPRSRDVEVEEEYAESYQEQEAYQEQEPYSTTESYQEQVPYTYQEAYAVQEPYQETEYHTVTVQEQRQVWKHGGIRRALGEKKTITENVQKQVPVSVTKHREVTKHRDATGYRQETKTRNVTKYRQVTRHRDVTRYRTATRMVTRSVEYQLPIQDFYRPALDDILAEARRSFTTPAVAQPEEVYPAESVSQVGLSQTSRGVAQRILDANTNANPSDHDDGEGSWISVGLGPHCFAADALFEVASGPQCSYLLEASELVCGSRVHAEDDTEVVLEAKYVSKEKARTLLQLRAGPETAPLRITPSHRMVVPASGGTGTEIRRAEELRPGDRVVCCGGEVRELTEVQTMEGDFEVVAITFDPDLPVAVFHAPRERMQSMGEEPRKKRIRRSGMNRRGRSHNSASTGYACAEVGSIPETALGEYHD